jgi:hypothetical protein
MESEPRTAVEGSGAEWVPRDAVRVSTLPDLVTVAGPIAKAGVASSWGVVVLEVTARRGAGIAADL